MLAYAKNDHAGVHLFIYDLDKKTNRQLTKGRTLNSEPFFIDNKIIFTSNRSGHAQIHEYNLENNEIKRVTHLKTMQPVAQLHQTKVFNIFTEKTRANDNK